MLHGLDSKGLCSAVAAGLAFLASSCAPPLMLTSLRSGNDIRFDFGGDVFVSAIVVREIGSPPNALAVCTVRPAAPLDSASRSRWWVYGRALSPQVVPTSPCARLIPGHGYDINVYHSGHCFTMGTFRISSDGAVAELEDRGGDCWM